MHRKLWLRWLSCAALAAAAIVCPQAQPPAPSAAVRLKAVSSLPGRHRAVPGVAWLTPLAGTGIPPFAPQGRYTLLQKNRTFIPHLQVIPVGAVVRFPNDDPFYHNVFSLYEGKRFDLGLYEAGTSKSETFSREGVSYIFCNIHPEMSAVIVALSTPLYAIADSSGAFVFRNVPPGDYKLHVWLEGVPQPDLARLDRTVHVAGRDLDLGILHAPIAQPRGATHLNMFGKPYDTIPQTSY